MILYVRDDLILRIRRVRRRSNVHIDVVPVASLLFNVYKLDSVFVVQFRDIVDRDSHNTSLLPPFVRCQFDVHSCCVPI